MDRYEHVKFLIERFDHYYDSVNNKGSFYIALNTFIFGGICVGYLTLYEKVHADWSIWIPLGLLALCNLISLGLTVWATMPFLKDNGTNEQSPSLVFFGGISRHELTHFREKLLGANDDVILDDTIQQAHNLANGLSDKYRKLRWSSRFMVVQFILMAPLLLLIVKNLK